MNAEDFCAVCGRHYALHGEVEFTSTRIDPNSVRNTPHEFTPSKLSEPSEAEVRQLKLAESRKEMERLFVQLGKAVVEYVTIMSEESEP